jgi:hypothetical protein
VGAQDIAQQNRIRNARKRRLYVLEEQAAQYGLDCPPHITVEIASLKKELEIRESIIASPIEAEVAASIGPDGQFIALTQFFDQVNKGISMIGQRVDDVHGYLDERISRIEETDFEYRSTERQDRIAGQDANKRLILAVGVVFLILILAIAGVLSLVVKAVLDLQGLGFLLL